ncbi:craniofacial development protein 1 [Belonocnema kinseyi]|uniref:craniofacial development protein 1 n=1 Tax=Belonocnema kinseyi TaxID=2817044 RepID=UPI00143CD7A3|nr:craniofacial development protein 1 [Belonocnema kinseyi]
MSEKHELPSDSDEDDEDYVPEGHESVSEVESDGDAENSPDDDNQDIRKDTDVSKRRKRCKSMKSKDAKRKKKQRKSAVEEKEAEKCAEEDNKAKVLSEEEEKKRADSLWADFMKDTGVVSKPKSENSTSTKSSEKSDSLVARPKVEEKIKITKIFEFAGEKVKVEKEVSADSAEARLSATTENLRKNVDVSPVDEKKEVKGVRSRKVGLGGISSIIGQLGKKSKISTLEKSKLDWDNFKKEEKIEEEISTHNKGKDGYLEKQDFLQRADLRQFEIEKQLRTTSRRSNR